MNDQHSASIVITFLLLLPWLGRAAVSAMAVWRARTESKNQRGNCAIADCVADCIWFVVPQPTG